MYAWIKKGLFQFDPEQAHHWTVAMLAYASKRPALLRMWQTWNPSSDVLRLATTCCGHTYAHPLGLSAGLDKNGVAVEAWEAFGFAFTEVGTVTPLAQSGNERPRLFRLLAEEALINRMGFNNDGAERLVQRLQQTHARNPVWINIGKNKATPNEQALQDYVFNLERLYAYGNVFVVNVSSPNTPGLRDLQEGETMHTLLASLVAKRTALVHQNQTKKPLMVKISPDLSDKQLADTVQAIEKAGIDGIVATNTTMHRDGVAQAYHRDQAGGLSGQPLKARATAVIRDVYKATQGRIPIIGSGGIRNAEDAYEKIQAGATLVQLYTALIYEGPALVQRIVSSLAKRVEQEGFTSIQQAVGAKTHVSYY